MDFYRAAMQSGFQPLLDEAMPTVTSSTSIFNNAPKGTKFIAFTVIGGTLTMRFDGQVVTATTGLNFAANTASDPYALPLSETNAKKVRAIGAAVTSGFITYWGV